jgi:hypothetical protein
MDRRDPIDVKTDIHRVHALNPDINSMVDFLEGVQPSVHMRLPCTECNGEAAAKP